MKLLEDDGAAGAASRAQRREHRSSVRASLYPGSEPGPPVEGALLRIDEWLMDVDERGVPLKVIILLFHSWPFSCTFSVLVQMVS
jgi:hypothetical protein